ncbi:6366_t:CDS:10, partial [Paraglomus occultum]
MILTSLLVKCILLSIISFVVKGEETFRIWKYYERVITVVLSRADYNDVIADPYFFYLAEQGILLSNSHAIWRPSQPNYIAMIHGSKGGVLFNSDSDVDGSSLPERLEERNITWKAYMENYPGDGFTGSHDEQNLYYRKHNPFISMTNIRENPDMVAKIVNADQLKTDMENKDVPEYCFYVPNIMHSGHETNVTYTSNYIQYTLMPILQPILTSSRTLLIITYDEPASLTEIATINHIFTLLIGPNVLRPRIHEDATYYNHYSVLVNIEDNWNLTRLGTDHEQDATAIEPNLFLIRLSISAKPQFANNKCQEGTKLTLDWYMVHGKTNSAFATNQQGLLVLAFDPETANTLANSLRNDQWEKWYRALVRLPTDTSQLPRQSLYLQGTMIAPTGRLAKSGRLHSWITRSPVTIQPCKIQSPVQVDSNATTITNPTMEDTTSPSTLLSPLHLTHLTFHHNKLPHSLLSTSLANSLFAHSVPPHYPSSKPSSTSFYLDAIYPTSRTVLYNLLLHTGRTHQIRVHLAEAGFPIVGDYVYENLRRRNAYNPDAELALQSCRIKFPMPGVDGEWVDVKVEIPQDWLKWMFVRMFYETETESISIDDEGEMIMMKCLNTQMLRVKVLTKVKAPVKTQTEYESNPLSSYKTPPHDSNQFIMDKEQFNQLINTLTSLKIAFSGFELGMAKELLNGAGVYSQVIMENRSKRTVEGVR